MIDTRHFRLYRVSYRWIAVGSFDRVVAEGGGSAVQCTTPRTFSDVGLNYLEIYSKGRFWDTLSCILLEMQWHQFLVQHILSWISLSSHPRERLLETLFAGRLMLHAKGATRMLHYGPRNEGHPPQLLSSEKEIGQECAYASCVNNSSRACHGTVDGLPFLPRRVAC